MPFASTAAYLGHVRPDSERAASSADRRAKLNRRLRAEFIAGAEESSRRRLGRGGLTREELERVLRHYPGDV
jgi:hypothetical protein